MQKLLLPLLLILFNYFLKAQVTFYNYFEGPPSTNNLTVTILPTPNNIWQIGKPQKTLFSAASSTPNVIITDTINKYPVNNASTFTMVILTNTFLPFPTVVRWKQKLDMQLKRDGGFVEFSTNSGVTWQNTHNNPLIYQYYGFMPANKDTIAGNPLQHCFTGIDNVWRDIWLCFPPNVANLNDSLFIRFRFKSDSVQTNQEGWMIDNFMAMQTIIHPVKEISQIDNIVVYPNVTNGVLNVEMKKRSDKDVIQNIDLFDESGRLVENFGQNYTKVVLDISKHKPGNYYLKVTINNKVSKFKILYEKN
jgi:hypothetical protein